MLDIVADNGTVGVLVALIGGGGLGGAITALYKWRPEKTNLLVQASDKAVTIQGNVLDDVYRQMELLQSEVVKLRAEVHEVRTMLNAKRHEADALRVELAEVKLDRDGLRARLGLA